MIAQPLVDYLVAHGARRARHAGRRSLLEHLVGTHDLLAKWRAEEAVCLAGLFHSVYGTTIYRRRSVPLSERSAVAALIGARAEKLAFLFCISDRPGAWDEPAWRLFPRLATANGAPVALARAELRGLVQIECANLLDQPGGVPQLAALAPQIEADRGLVIPACRRAVLQAVNPRSALRTLSSGR